MISTAEQLLTLSEAAATLPHRPSIPTLWRWARKGLKGVKLEYARIGGRILVSQESLRRFGEELAKADTDPTPTVKPTPRRTPAQRAAAVASAKARCATAGSRR
ncbi:MAG: DUF1580 domain-containing protein [Candidatus Hydrogenedentes bacterium]|nr:DUF1580 domain-containing protein [Candidatus Hydrogenedentota bacterium]